MALIEQRSWLLAGPEPTHGEGARCSRLKGASPEVLQAFRRILVNEKVLSGPQGYQLGPSFASEPQRFPTEASAEHPSLMSGGLSAAAGAQVKACEAFVPSLKAQKRTLDEKQRDIAGEGAASWRRRRELAKGDVACRDGSSIAADVIDLHNDLPEPLKTL